MLAIIKFGKGAANVKLPVIAIAGVKVSVGGSGSLKNSNGLPVYV
jgi:hypothetical protein